MFFRRAFPYCEWGWAADMLAVILPSPNTAAPDGRGGCHMPTVHDVAAYILSKRSPLTAMKLQKLVYYAQAWSLVWDEEPLFSERIEAWANGPVAPELYKIHKGWLKVTSWPKGDPSALSKKQRESVDAVIKFYGRLSAQALSDLTHAEDPWRRARVGLSPIERSSRAITHAAMMEFYGGL
jgi:uncharacterized phage-associated protein